VKERPILMNGAMVRATLAEIKSQTRRIVKPSRAWPIDFVGGSGQINDPTCWGFEDGDTALWWLLKRDDDALSRQIPCPYGQPGDRLWVRETYYAFGRWETRFSAKKKRDEWHFVDMTRDTDRLYQFGTESIEPCLRARDPGILPTWWKRPSIFMPRDASRILLEIVSVRVERLQDISDDDAEDEGTRIWAPEVQKNGNKFPSIRSAWQALWESINGAGSWDVNPWVWVVEFRRIKQ